MFQKLFKYEALAVGRVMLPVWLGALVLATLSSGGMQLQNLPPFSGTPFLVILWTVVAPLSVLSLLAVIAVCIAANIQRFYTLLGVRGYLYFCLPVNPWQQLAAKWAVAMVSSAISVPVLLLCSWLMGGDWRLTLFAGDHALIRIEDLDLTWQGRRFNRVYNSAGGPGSKFRLPVFLPLHRYRRALAAAPAGGQRDRLLCAELYFAGPASFGAGGAGRLSL